MIAFEVYVNKLKVCTAGLDKLEFVSAALSSFVISDGQSEERSLHFSVHGMKNRMMYDWVRYHLQKGDRVEIRIVDTKKTDKPKVTKYPGGVHAT